MCAKRSPLRAQRCASRRQRLCVRRPTRPRMWQVLREQEGARVYSKNINKVCLPCQCPTLGKLKSAAGTLLLSDMRPLRSTKTQKRTWPPLYTADYQIHIFYISVHHLYSTVAQRQCRSMHVGSASMRWISTLARDCWEAGASCWCRYRTRCCRDRSILMSPFE